MTVPTFVDWAKMLRKCNGEWWPRVKSGMREYSDESLCRIVDVEYYIIIRIQRKEEAMTLQLCNLHGRKVKE